FCHDSSATIYTLSYSFSPHSYSLFFFFFFFNDTATTEIYTLSLHDALPICGGADRRRVPARTGDGRLHRRARRDRDAHGHRAARSEEHTSELQSRENLVCRLLLEKKKKKKNNKIEEKTKKRKNRKKNKEKTE